MTPPDAPPVIVVHADIVAENLDFADIPAYDVMITDPPYSPHVHENAVSTGTKGRGPVDRDLGFDALSPELRSTIARMGVRAPRWSIVFSDLEGTHHWRESFTSRNMKYVRTVPWVRWSQPQITGDRPPTGAEAILWFHGRGVKMEWSGPGNLTHFAQKALRASRGQTEPKHPTGKPLDLMLDLVSMVTKPGEIVLDPCAGHATTALACQILGRGCIAIERDAEHARRGEARINGLARAQDMAHAERWIEDTFASGRALQAGSELTGPAQDRFMARLRDVHRARAWLRSAKTANGLPLTENKWSELDDPR